MTWVRPVALCLAIAVPVALTGCGGDDKDGSSDAGPGLSARSGPGSAASQAEPAAMATLDEDGPGACFDLVTEHLGAETKVNEIDSNFSTGKDIDPQLVDPEKTPEVGTLTFCSVKYQDPDDPKKLVETSLDRKTGTFSDPRPLEITVMGDAASFDLEDYLIPLSKIDTTPLPALMEQQQGTLDGAFSAHAWSGVDLSAPDQFSGDHLLRLDVAGRLASNDILDHGFLQVSVDGTKVVGDHLQP